MPPRTYSPVTPRIIAQLEEIFSPGGISTTKADLALRANDQGIYDPHPADALVWPTSTIQVSQLMSLANCERIPVTPWGAGTSLEGNPIPVRGGIQISFERMNRVLTIHADDFQVTVEPGIGHKDLNAQLARHGLFFPPDPGANASIGGMLANNAAGIRTVKYGATRDNVLKMEIVLADGRILTVGSRSVKQSSGYDLLHLVVGSEGTLAIITQATLKLVPVAEHICTAIAAFETIEAAIEAVVFVRGSGLEPAALEFLDATTVELLSQHDQLGLAVKPTVLMEFHTTHASSMNETLAALQEISMEAGAVQFHANADRADRLKLWHARHQTHEIIVQKHPGKKLTNSDVAVPISAYPELVAFIQAQRQQWGATAYVFGHAGDGNIHVVYVYGTEEEYQVAKVMNAAVVHKAIALAGTATGEHGVGLGKIEFMQTEHGLALDVMRQLKDTLDPNWILNPGKIFPEGKSR